MTSADSDRRGDVSPRQVAEALVFVPIGLGASIVSGAPARVRQLRSDLATARFLGEMAVTQGAAQVRARLAADDDTADSAPSASSASTETPEPMNPSEPATVDSAVEAVDAVPATDALAIPDYDTVPAIDIVMQLADLDDAERDAIEAYERAHRGRRTVLGKLDQLRADS